uniref:Tail assembly chaperone n=1 Tax=Siphoviridae sp. ctt8434 TaxID=2825703 RepID=A0A8S5U1J1_9CAUD|nr:MAG TPA: tail assembly chaperone [Siphoviridae sp. ctt8434]
MTDNTIQKIGLKNENILKLEIVDEKGNSTEEFLEFDLEDIELPFKYQEILERLKKSRQNLKNQFTIIEKKQDHKGKKLMSSNEEEKLKALNNFYKEQVEIYNIFLGENGVQKLLNGRKLRWTTLSEIDELIEKQIAPQLNVTMDDITKKIKSKYSNKKEDNILE